MSDNNLPVQANRISQIESKIDRDVAGQTLAALGGAVFKTMAEVMEFAKLMSVSGVAVPKHLRGEPGTCLAVAIQSLEWRMSPYAVGNKSYVVNDRIAYESQLIHAVIEQRAPLAGRLRCRYTGEGGNRRCIVYAKIKGEEEPFEYQSAPFDSIQPKNSPLWKTKPDLQLFYNASRDWARMYFPDVIMGVYSEDEIDTTSPFPQTRGAIRGQAPDVPTVAAEQKFDVLDGPEIPPNADDPKPLSTAGEAPNSPGTADSAQAGDSKTSKYPDDFWLDSNAGLEAIKAALAEQKVGKANREAATVRYAISLGRGPAAKNLTPDDMQRLYEAIVNGQFDAAKGVIL